VRGKGAVLTSRVTIQTNRVVKGNEYPETKGGEKSVEKGDVGGKKSKGRINAIPRSKKLQRGPKKKVSSGPNNQKGGLPSKKRRAKEKGGRPKTLT